MMSHFWPNRMGGWNASVISDTRNDFHRMGSDVSTAQWVTQETDKGACSVFGCRFSTFQFSLSYRAQSGFGLRIDGGKFFNGLRLAGKRGTHIFP